VIRNNWSNTRVTVKFKSEHGRKWIWNLTVAVMQITLGGCSRSVVKCNARPAVPTLQLASFQIQCFQRIIGKIKFISLRIKAVRVIHIFKTVIFFCGCCNGDFRSWVGGGRVRSNWCRSCWIRRRRICSRGGCRAAAQ